MSKKKMDTRNPGYNEVDHKDTIINLPLSLSFYAGEFPLSDIRNESGKINEYSGSIGDIIAGGEKIGEAGVREDNTDVRIKMKILPKKDLEAALEKSTVSLTCVLDAFHMPAGAIAQLGHGSMIPLKKNIDSEPVSLLANGRTIADGELCLVGDYFGVRVITLSDPDAERIIMDRTGDEPEAYCCIVAGKKEAAIKEVYTLGEGSLVRLNDQVSDLFHLVINGQEVFLVELVSEGENIFARIYDPGEFAGYTLEQNHPERKKQHTKPGSKRDPVSFDFITETDAFMFYRLFGQEHPQTIALILSCLPPGISRIALMSLPVELKADVIQRISRIQKADKGTLYQIEEYVKEKIAGIPPDPAQEPGGIEHIIAILKGIVDDERKNILEALKQNNKILADEIQQRL